MFARRSIIGLSLAAAALAACLTLGACANDAQVASQNLSQAADNFEINRRVVFYNGVTDTYVLTIEGLCALSAEADKKLTVTCKVGPGTFKKHFLWRSDNVTAFAEQIDPAPAGTSHYRVTFKPSTIVPDVQLR